MAARLLLPLTLAFATACTSTVSGLDVDERASDTDRPAGDGNGSQADDEPNSDAPPGDGGLTVPDDDPAFPVGDVHLRVDGAVVTVHADREVKTAAGIYTTDDVLVRTLWRTRTIAANGDIDITWDGRDDDGNSVPDGTYRVTVIAHNVAYDWEGVVGNTSNPGAAGAVDTNYTFGSNVVLKTVGSHVHRGLNPITQIAIANGRAYTASGYNEQQQAMARFEVDKPQVRDALLRNDFQREFRLVTTDGTIAYFANTGVFGDGDLFFRPENFIVGVRVSDDSEVQFASGAPWTIGLGDGNHWNSVIDAVPDGNDRIQGVVVEKTGSHLYVAHKNSGIKIFDKTSGAIGGSFDVPNASALAIDTQGNLWVVSNGTEVRCYGDPAGAHTLLRTVDGFAKAIGVGVSPGDGTLVVVDGGPNAQRLLAYDSATGNPRWTHGKPGGYSRANGPEVTSDKLNITDTDVSYVAFENDDTFWVGERGNLRNLKFQIPSGASGSNPLVLRDQIMFIPASYSAAVDRGDPRRVFNGYLEFSVDYTKPLPQAWKLTHNWDTQLPGYYFARIQSGFRDVVTTHGHTFAVVKGPNGTDNLIVELTAGGVRETARSFPFGARMHEGGTIRYASSAGGRYTIKQRELTGVDGNGDPVFAAEHTVASAPQRNAANVQNPIHGPCSVDPQEETFPKTDSGLIVTFDPCSFADSGAGYDPTGNHLGGIRADADDFAFRASPGGTFNLEHDLLIVARDGTFNLQRLQQNYAASVAMTAGRQVVYNYFGEFWNNGQATQFMHWLDNGLFVGQFGEPAYPDTNRYTPVVGSAGNTFSPAMIMVDGAVFVYHNDESAHGGVHRWRLRNLGSIQKMVGNIGKNTAVQNPADIPGVAY